MAERDGSERDVDVREAIDRVAAVLGARAERDVPIGPHTTYRVGGAAALFTVAHSLADVVDAGTAARTHGVALLVLGRGSNLLVSERGFAGLVLMLGDFAAGISIDGTTVHAGAAVPLPVLARKTVAAGLDGLAWMVGIPGSVGGAVRMNAGGHGSDVASDLLDAEVLDLADATVRRVPADALGLAFRRSALRDEQVVLGARFRLRPGSRAAGEAALAEIVHWRREHQPGGQNAGSVFVNPRPHSSGALIDGLGLRGMRLGTAHVSEKHANFIQADEGGRADDVVALMREVRRRVREATGILLRSEIRLVGFPVEEPPFDVGIGYQQDDDEGSAAARLPAPDDQGTAAVAPGPDDQGTAAVAPGPHDDGRSAATPLPDEEAR